MKTQLGSITNQAADVQALLWAKIQAGKTETAPRAAENGGMNALDESGLQRHKKQDGRRSMLARSEVLEPSTALYGAALNWFIRKVCT